MSEPMIIIEPCAGLGNRLLGLGSAYAVAEKIKPQAGRDVET